MQEHKNNTNETLLYKNTKIVNQETIERVMKLLTRTKLNTIFGDQFKYLVKILGTAITISCNKGDKIKKLRMMLIFANYAINDYEGLERLLYKVKDKSIKQVLMKELDEIKIGTIEEPDICIIYKNKPLTIKRLWNLCTVEQMQLLTNIVESDVFNDDIEGALNVWETSIIKMKQQDILNKKLIKEQFESQNEILNKKIANLNVNKIQIGDKIVVNENFSDNEVDYQRRQRKRERKRMERHVIKDINNDNEYYSDDSPINTPIHTPSIKRKIKAKTSLIRTPKRKARTRIKSSAASLANEYFTNPNEFRKDGAFKFRGRMKRGNNLELFRSKSRRSKMNKRFDDLKNITNTNETRDNNSNNNNNKTNTNAEEALNTIQQISNINNNINKNNCNIMEKDKKEQIKEMKKKGDKYGRTITDLTNHKNLQKAIELSKKEHQNNNIINSNITTNNKNDLNNKKIDVNNKKEPTNVDLPKGKKDLLHAINQKYKNIEHIQNEIEHLKEEQNEQKDKEAFTKAILEKETQDDIEILPNIIMEKNININIQNQNEQIDNKIINLDKKLNEEQLMRNEIIKTMETMNILNDCDDLIKNKINTILQKQSIKILMEEIYKRIEKGNENELDLKIETEKRFKNELHTFENENETLTQILQQVLDNREIKTKIQKQKLLKKQEQNKDFNEDQIINDMLNDINPFITQNKPTKNQSESNDTQTKDKKDNNEPEMENKKDNNTKSCIYKLINTVNKNKNYNKNIIGGINIHANNNKNQDEIQKAHYFNKKADLYINMNHENKIEYEITVLNEHSNKMQHVLSTKDKKEVNKVINDLLHRNYNINSHANHIHNDDLNQKELKEKQQIEDERFISKSTQVIINEIKRSEQIVKEVVLNIIKIAFRKANEDGLNDENMKDKISIYTNFERKSRIIDIEFLNDKLRRKIQYEMAKTIEEKEVLKLWTIRTRLNKQQLKEKKLKQEEDDRIRQRLNDQIANEYNEYNKKTIDNLYKRVDEGETLNDENIQKINTYLNDDIKETKALKQEIDNELNKNKNINNETNFECQEERQRYDYNEYDYEYYNRRERVENEERIFNRRGNQTIKARDNNNDPNRNINPTQFKYYNNNTRYNKQRYYRRKTRGNDRRYNYNNNYGSRNYNNRNERNYEHYNNYGANDEYVTDQNDYNDNNQYDTRFYGNNNQNTNANQAYYKGRNNKDNNE